MSTFHGPATDLTMRKLQIERDALIIAGNLAMPTLYCHAMIAESVDRIRARLGADGKDMRNTEVLEHFFTAVVLVPTGEPITMFPAIGTPNFRRIADWRERNVDMRETDGYPLSRLLTHQEWALELGSIERFNESAWLGENGILAKYIASPVRGHRCIAGDVTALVWGCRTPTAWARRYAARAGGRPRSKSNNSAPMASVARPPRPSWCSWSLVSGC